MYRGEPVPVYHDEFSYLFGADTFSHFRLTNPVWENRDHFRTFHILSEPTTMSRYPPGQALFLAFGQVMTGHPIAGAILSVVLACAAFSWLLYPVTGFVWSIAGGLALAVSPTIVEWTRTYWGGGVAVLGSALVLGSLIHISVGEPRRRFGISLGLGLFLLAITRPVEGFCFAAPLMIGTGLLLWRAKKPFRRILIPLFGTLLITGSWLGYYHYRVTGSPFVMPAQAYVKQYSEAPPFIFMKPNTPTIPPVLRVELAFNKWELSIWEASQTWEGSKWVAGEKLTRIAPILPSPFWIAIPLAIAGLCFLPAMGWVVSVSFATFFVCFVLESFFSVHYAAPLVPAVFLLSILPLQNGSRLFKKRSQAFSIASGVILIAWMVSAVATTLNTDPIVPGNWSLRRADLLSQLKEQPLKFLVFVRYGEGHNFHEEWVYNEANLDEAKVIFARDLGSEPNRSLLARYPDRRVLLVTLTERTLSVDPYKPN